MTLLKNNLKTLNTLSNLPMSEKDRLKQASMEFRDAIKQQISGSFQEVESKGKQYLMVTGGIIAVYAVLHLFFSTQGPKSIDVKSASKDGDGEEHIVVVENKDYGILRMIKESIASFLISIAKQKLMEILQELSQKTVEGIKSSNSEK